MLANFGSPVARCCAAARRWPPGRLGRIHDDGTVPVLTRVKRRRQQLEQWRSLFGFGPCGRPQACQSSGAAIPNEVRHYPNWPSPEAKHLNNKSPESDRSGQETSSVTGFLLGPLASLSQHGGLSQPRQRSLRSSSLSFAATSAPFAHSCSVCAAQPIMPDIDITATHRGECSRLCTSAEYLFIVLLMVTPASEELEPPANPKRFTCPQPPQRRGPRRAA